MWTQKYKAIWNEQKQEYDWFVMPVHSWFPPTTQRPTGQYIEKDGLRAEIYERIERKPKTDKAD